VHNAVGFNYRRLPAIALMRRMIAEGVVGEVRLWRATWLSDEFADPATPWDWRFDRAMGGTTIADLGSHLIDMALCMAGPVDSVCAGDDVHRLAASARRRHRGGDRGRRRQCPAPLLLGRARDLGGRAGRRATAL